MGTRNDDISLILAKAKKQGFLPDVYDSEVDLLEIEARKMFGTDSVTTSNLHSSVRRSASTVFLGDSLTQIGTITANRQYGNSMPSLVCALSDGKIIMAENAGVASDTVPMIADRVQVEVISKAPGRCFILAGANSTTKGQTHYDLARFDYENRIILPLLSAGIEPILATIPPRDNARTTTGTNLGLEVYRMTLAWNVFVRAMATKYRLQLVDIYAFITDYNTGNYKAGWTDDGVHWSYSGTYAVAQYIVDQLLPSFPAVAVPLEKDRYSTINFSADPLFLGTFTNGSGGRFPLGWNGASTSPPAISATVSSGSDNLEAGKWFTVAKTGASSTNVNLIKTLSAFNTASGLTAQAGDRIGLGFRYQIRGITAGGYVTTSLSFRGAGGSAEILKTITPQNQLNTASEGVIWIEDIIPAGTVDLRFDIGQGAAGDSIIDIGQFSLYDLTAMGSPSLLSAV